MNKIKYAGVVVLYNPEDDYINNINSYIDDIDLLYVIDNSEKKHKIPDNNKIEYIFNNENIGVAAALNIAAQKAINAKYKWLLTMDQDTTFNKGVMNVMKKYIENNDTSIDAVVTVWHDTKLDVKRPKEIDSRVQAIIDFSELGDAIDTPVRTYSSGMYMRLAFSVAINVDAEILLIDEILAVGDQHFQDKCFDKLQQLKNSDKTIVIVSHSLESIKKLCNRGIWINEGKVEMDGQIKDVISEYVKVCG